MSLLISLARWLMVGAVGAFFIVVFSKLLTSNALAGLLSGKRFDPNTETMDVDAVTAGRVQSLVFVVYFAVYYLIQILHSPHGFPPISKSMLYVLGGSQATYLSGKVYGQILGPALNELKKGISR